MLESLFFGFSLFALTHLAVQCVSAIFCLFKEVTFRSLLWLHILSFLLYSVFKVPLSDLSIGGGLKWTRTTDLTLIRRAL